MVHLRTSSLLARPPLSVQLFRTLQNQHSHSAHRIAYASLRKKARWAVACTQDDAQAEDTPQEDVVTIKK